MNNRTYKGILADLDGTINRGGTIIPGADATYLELAKRGLKWVFVSNAATRLASDIAAKINRLGIPVADGQVINSAAALLRTLVNEWRGARVMVIGEPKLIGGIKEAGFAVTDDPDATDLVTVALDTDFTYDKLRRAHRAIQNGAVFWATNLDPTYPVADGFLPGAGSVVAAVATAAGRPPDRIFGKPSPDMAFLALELMDLDAESCLVVGDRMETDILFAKNAGMDAALVLTGATVRERLGEYDYAPDYVFDSINEIRTLFE